MKQLDFVPDDDMAEIQRHLGIIWMKREKYEEALAMFEKALKIKVSISADSSDKFQRNLMECFVGALESVEVLYGPDHLRYAKVSKHTDLDFTLYRFHSSSSLFRGITPSSCTRKATSIPPTTSTHLQLRRILSVCGFTNINTGIIISA